MYFGNDDFILHNDEAAFKISVTVLRISFASLSYKHHINMKEKKRRNNDRETSEIYKKSTSVVCAMKDK